MKRITPILILISLAFSYSELKQNHQPNKEKSELPAELGSSNRMQEENNNDMYVRIATFLTFQKEDAEEAMNFYVGLFDNSEILNVIRWEEGGPGKEGTIMHATFSLDGNMFMCSDSPPIHEWDFTPAVSNYVQCKDDKEIEQLFSKLSENGAVMMPLNNYGFSQKFGFIEDRFGVSWQLNLP